jgi:hypothetical protein
VAHPISSLNFPSRKSVYFSSALGELLALLSLNTRDTESPGLFSEYTLSSSFALNGTVYSLVNPFTEVFFCILPSGSFGSRRICSYRKIGFHHDSLSSIACGSSLPNLSSPVHICLDKSHSFPSAVCSL